MGSSDHFAVSVVRQNEQIFFTSHFVHKCL